MNQDGNLSQSDDSDEDFCPDKTEYSDDSEEDGEKEVELISDKKTEKHLRKMKLSKKSKHYKRYSAKVKRENLDVKTEQNNSKPSSCTPMQTRSAPKAYQSTEKNEIKSDDEEEKSRIDILWENFLKDVKPVYSLKTKKPEKSEKVLSKKPKTSSKAATTSCGSLKDKPSSRKHCKDRNRGDKAKAKMENGKTPIAVKPSATMDGLGAAVSNIEIKKKASVLENSKNDWNVYKEKKGLQEDLTNHNKGRDAFSERLAFLERMDLRQFEIEKKLRKLKRKK